MDQELKSKWIAALRSGTYKQAQGDLQCKGGFCCLGVLLDVSGRGKWDGDTYVVGDGPDERYIAGELEDYANDVGLTNQQETVLIRMNDGKKEYEGKPKTFAEIADYIERNL